MIKQRLKEIGLSTNEAEIYSQLLKSGARPASTITHTSKINRSTVYNTLKNLIQKGLIATYQQDHTSYFKANDPNCLLTYLESKSNHYKYYKAVLSSKISDYRRLYNSHNSEQPSVQITANKLAIQTTIKTNKHPIKAILEPEQLKILPRNQEIQLITNKPITKKHPWLKHKTTDINISVNTLIFQNKVIIFDQSSPGEFTITLNSYKIAQNYQLFFEKLWKLSK